jgi:hypothetical protein
MATLWNRINTIILVCVLFALIAVIGMLAGGVRGGPLDPPGPPGSTDSVRLPGTPISDVPFAITWPGHYYLTRDLALLGGTAITVTASDVSIDLNGFTLWGPAAAPLDEHGIEASGGAQRITITNGTIRGWDKGIDLASAAESRIADVLLTKNKIGAYVGAQSVIERCAAHGNGIGVYVGGALSAVRDCHITTSSGNGIQLTGTGPALVEDSTIYSNNQLNSPATGGISVGAGRATIRDNEFANNAQFDVRGFGLNAVVIDNVFTCPTWMSFGPTGTGYAPVNNLSPHENRTILSQC